MSKSSKVVWFEGMTLDPHHFQQWDRYYSTELTDRTSIFSPFPWGFQSYEIDETALKGGQFRLNQCKGIIKDGFGFSIPNPHKIARIAELETYFDSQQISKLHVYLGIPIDQVNAINCLIDDKAVIREPRYKAEPHEVADDNTGSEKREIRIAAPNLKLLINEEAGDEFSLLKVAEIIKSKDGSLGLNPSFVPPVLFISSNKLLMDVVLEVKDLISGQIDELSQQRSQKDSGVIDFTTTDIKMFWLLQALSATLPIINHYYYVVKPHPEIVYQALLRFAGRLSTFSADRTKHPNNFPQYDHQDLANCFQEMRNLIDGLIEDAIPETNYETISLEEKNNYRYSEVSRHILQSRQFMLAIEVLTDMENAKDFEDAVLNNIKVASPDTIDNYVGQFQRALPLKFVPHPPPGIPRRPDLFYFEFNKRHSIWKDVEKEEYLVIYSPDDLNHNHFELISIK